MGNKFSYDEQVEELVRKIANTHHFEKVDPFFRQLLSDIGGGQIEQTPSYLDLNMIRAA